MIEKEKFLTRVVTRAETLGISNVEMVNCDLHDYPDFCDAFIGQCDIHGVPATEEQLDAFSDNEPEMVFDLAMAEFLCFE
jgi:hypothetical protein